MCWSAADDDELHSHRYGEKQRRYAIGAVSLAQARAERDVVKGLLREGVDPVAARRIRKASNVAASAETFEKIADQWLAKNKRFWSGIHYEKSTAAFARDVFPVIGRLPIADITPAVVASVITKIQKRGVDETASKILQHINGVFRYAQALGLRNDNPAEPVRELIPKKRVVTPRPAIIDITELRTVLDEADRADVSEQVRLCSRLVAFSASRIGPAVEAEWSEFNLDAPVPTWTIPRAKQKAKDRPHPHIVYFGPYFAAELRQWKKRTGGKGYVFRGQQGRKFIGREAVEKLYADVLGLKGRMSPHSWRTAFSSLMRDAGHPRDVVELCLDHVRDPSAVLRAYDRGTRTDARIEVARAWDALLAGPPSAPPIVLPFRSSTASTSEPSASA